MRYLVVYEKGSAGLGAFVPDLPGCVAVGSSEPEVSDRIRAAVELHLRTLRREGRPVPEPACHADFIDLPD